MTDTLFLTSDEVDGLATPAEYVDVVREGYRQRGEGAPALPRQTFRNENPDGKLTNYSTILPETGAMGGYVYTSGFSGPNAWFVTPLFDAESGEPIALIDGASMNPFKTGATGAVAVDALSRDDASTLAVIGSGAQARGQLHATMTVRDFESVRVFSPTPNNRKTFAAEFDDHLDVSVEAVDSSEAAVTDADVVITATKAADPVFDGDNLDPGTHVTAMGQYTPGRRELDTTTIERATYVPDLRDRVTQDAGSFLAALEEGVVDEDHVHAELGEVVAGTAPGRTSDDEITVFDSGGTGIETVAAGYMLYERALEEELGTELSIAPASKALTGRLPSE
ncbi:alanine dehydrogenase [Halalkalicoccus paucihalophilus]|uniref:Alanine dehydrogenase n=1 Tax=Halalkalicoccus paucihalophilus TaxID=1008153 RepID=A0A151AB97_9EURY|nr:ornithine cyclodeaminase family protein [Halalkalicoccus paucihalophilus]KYH24976.1 alanine dehydrogenase [Halalkalicoccus paucihalophilus]